MGFFTLLRSQDQTVMPIKITDTTAQIMKESSAYSQGRTGRTCFAIFYVQRWEKIEGTF